MHRPGGWNSRMRRASSAGRRMLSEWRFNANPPRNTISPARNRGSPSLSTPYSPRCEMNRAFTYALSTLKANPEDATIAGMFRSPPRMRNGKMKFRFR